MLVICSSHVSNPEEKNMAALKDMFPDIEEDELSRALAAEGNVIENAIDNIMSKQEIDNTKGKAFMRGRGRRNFKINYI